MYVFAYQAAFDVVWSDGEGLPLLPLLDQLLEKYGAEQ